MKTLQKLEQQKAILYSKQEISTLKTMGYVLLSLICFWASLYFSRADISMPCLVYGIGFLGLFARYEYNYSMQIDNEIEVLSDKITSRRVAHATQPLRDQLAKQLSNLETKTLHSQQKQ